MAVDVDSARIDPFDDVYTQWSRTASQHGYDMVFSVGELLPAAVALGIVSGLRVAVVNSRPGRELDAFVHGEGDPGHPVAVAEATVNRMRRVTVTGIDVVADSPFTAHRHRGGAAEATPAVSLNLTPSAAPVGSVTVELDGALSTADTCEVAEQRGVVLRVGIDDRWCHARSIAVRALPEPLHVVNLGTSA